MIRQLPRVGVAALTALVFVAACDDGVTDPRPSAEVNQLPALAVKPGEPGSAAQRQLYQVRLSPLAGTTDHGTVLIEIVGGYLTVTVQAEGLDPLQHIPQHIHVNPTCAVGGGVLINLDENLSVTGEAPSTGAAFPVANGAGVVKYHATRSLGDLLQAVNTYAGANLASVDELVAWLDLGNRNVHMHLSASPFTPMTCGPVNRLN
jgi:hypothetical protein